MIKNVKKRQLSIEDANKLKAHFSNLPFSKPPLANEYTSLLENDLTELCEKEGLNTSIAPKLQWISTLILTIKNNLDDFKPKLESKTREIKDLMRLEQINIKNADVRSVTISFRDNDIKPIVIQQQLLIAGIQAQIAESRPILEIFVNGRGYDYDGYLNKITTILCNKMYEYFDEMHTSTGIAQLSSKKKGDFDWSINDPLWMADYA